METRKKRRALRVVAPVVCCLYAALVLLAQYQLGDPAAFLIIFGSYMTLSFMDRRRRLKKQAPAAPPPPPPPSTPPPTRTPGQQ